MRIYQKTVRLRPRPRGFHLITDEILEALPEIGGIKEGLLHLFLRHTSAGLSVNENADPDVRGDAARFFSRLVPDGWEGFAHTLEGDDDMPAHIASMLFGCQLTLPVTDGRVALGTWQGIYLVEWRRHAGARQITATLQGTLL